MTWEREIVPIIKTSVWRIRLLKVLFPRRRWVQIRGNLYWLGINGGRK